jgi:DNA-directed RNA polymerase specialized sigma24 family protein
MTNLDCITRSGECELVDQARAGETSGLVEYIYRLLQARAVHLVRGFRAVYGVSLDTDDLAQEGIVRVLRSLGGALATDHPIARLLTAAQFRMLDYCEENRTAIRVPACMQRRGAVVPMVDSLDASIVGTDDLTLLDLVAGEVRS